MTQAVETEYQDCPGNASLLEAKEGLVDARSVLANVVRTCLIVVVVVVVTLVLVLYC